MRILLPLLVLFTAATIAFGQALTQGERDRALSELYATRKAFLDSIAGLSEAQWNFKPDEKTWSIAECAEHIALSDDLFFSLIAEKLMKSPAQPEKRAEVRYKDEELLQRIQDRSHKAQAPEVLKPAHRWKTGAELAGHFRQSRDRTLDYIRTTNDALRTHFAAHPVFGVLDGYQWVLLMSGHTARHTAQLNEVKTNPAYPGR